MKVIFISDLHIDYNFHYDFHNALKKLDRQYCPNYIIFAGDTSTDSILALGFYQALQKEINAKILEIPGNHEMYYIHNQKKSGFDTDVAYEVEKRYSRLLNEPQYGLYQNPIITKEWAIIGTTGWYDFSFDRKYPNINLHRLHRKRPYGIIEWPDRIYIDGKDKDMYQDTRRTDQSIKELEELLKKVKRQSKKIAVVTHVLPTKALLKHAKLPVYRDCLNFLGSIKYEKLFEKYGVDLSISGHSHIRKKIEKNGIEYANVSLGCSYQWKNRHNVYEEMERAMYLLEW